MFVCDVWRALRVLVQHLCAVVFALDPRLHSLMQESARTTFGGRSITLIASHTCLAAHLLASRSWRQEEVRSVQNWFGPRSEANELQNCGWTTCLATCEGGPRIAVHATHSIDRA
jgi:hypothetical protein